MNESYKDVDINAMKQTVKDYREALKNSSSNEVIDDLTSYNVLQSDNNNFFVRSIEEIEEEKRKLSNAITIYEQMIQLIETHNNYEDKVVELNSEKNILVNNINTQLDEEEKIRLENKINNINDEIELYNKKMLEIRFRVDELSNEI